MSQTRAEFGLTPAQYRMKRPKHPKAMKKLISIFSIVAFVSALFIGCGFVDDNSAYVEAEDPGRIEIAYDGVPGKLDTLGYED